MTVSHSLPDRIAEAEILRASRTALAAERPELRARDAAAVLGVSEAALVASEVGERAVRLAPDMRQLIAGLPELGRVMVLTRNETAVHERKGVFGNIKTGGHVGLVLNESIDLRLFFAHWRFAFAVTEEARSGLRRSLQVFDADGVAVHKIYLLEESDAAAFDALVARWRAEDQAPGLDLPAPRRRGRASPQPEEVVDVEGFRAAWRGMQDVHEFHGMLRRHKLSRRRAMDLAEPYFVNPAPAGALGRALELAAARETPIMVFVNNRGCIQIHSGPIRTVRPAGDWDNVLDPDFNLHVRRDRVREAFVVRKPTADGVVTALELYDDAGDHVLQMFGVRKPGVPESPAWRRLTDDLLSAPVEAPA